MILAGIGVGLLLGASTPANAVDPATANLFAVTRSSDGHLHVVKGLAARIAQSDHTLGRTDTRVLTMEQDQPVRSLGDPMRGDQWALDRVNFESAWSATRGTGITVAVVDSGVAAGHQDLAGSVLPGTDLASDAGTYDPWGLGMVDPDGHGTHVAGVIAAHVNNGLGIAGAAPDVKILTVRVLDSSGNGVASNVADGIIWAADHGARVINVSIGGGASSGEQTAMQYALTKRALTVAAAGNYYQQGNPLIYPAAYPEALAVASTNSGLGHSSYSESGAQVDVAAPGEAIVSTYGGGRANDYQWMNGTSMASPYAAATAALVMAENTSLDPTTVKSIIESTAIDIGAPGRDDFFGKGLINPKAAVTAAVPMINNGELGNGYWVVGLDGRVHNFGNAGWYGDLGGQAHTGAIVASAHTPSGHGYWLAGSDGAVYGYGDAHYYGGMYGHPLNGKIVAMAATPSGHGYWLLGSDGGIFGFGDARYYGSGGNWHLNAPVLDIMSTASGHGYWLVAGDGGVFAFGDAPFRGSAGAWRLNKPVRSLSANADGSGYTLVATDGGTFSFHAPFHGSLPAVAQRTHMQYDPTVRVRSLPTDDGYYLMGVDGLVYAFGNAKYFGSAAGTYAVDFMLAP